LCTMPKLGGHIALIVRVLLFPAEQNLYFAPAYDVRGTSFKLWQE